jgi:SET domain-containing protein
LLSEGFYISNTIIKPSPISGKGTFATTTIKKGNLIFALRGISTNTKNLSSACAKAGIDTGDTIQIGIDEHLVVDHKSKIINHSCEPNACLRQRCDLYALRDIKPDEEITFDYATSVGVNDPWTLRCNCGSKNCRKLLGNVLSLPEEMLNEYIKLDAFTNFIKDQLKIIQARDHGKIKGNS